MVEALTILSELRDNGIERALVKVAIEVLDASKALSRRRVAATARGTP